MRYYQSKDGSGCHAYYKVCRSRNCMNTKTHVMNVIESSFVFVLPLGIYPVTQNVII